MQVTSAPDLDYLFPDSPVFPFSADCNLVTEKFLFLSYNTVTTKAERVIDMHFKLDKRLTDHMKEKGHSHILISPHVCST